MRICLQFALLLVALLATRLAAEELIDGVAAIVNDEVILLSELEQRLDEQEQASGRRPERVPVLEAMVSEQLQLQLAQRFNISVSNAEVNAVLNEQAARVGSDLGQYLEQLAAAGVDLERQRASLRRQLLLQKTRGQVLGRRIVVRDDEISAFFATRAAAEAFGFEYRIGYIGADGDQRQLLDDIYAELEQDDFAAVAARWSDDPRLRVRELDWQAAANLPTLFAELAPGLEPGETHVPVSNSRGWHLVSVLDRRLARSLVTEYELRLLSLTVNPVRDAEATAELARQLYEQIDSGAVEFAVAAQNYSDDALSAAAGGSLGWVATKPADLLPGLWLRISSEPQAGSLYIAQQDQSWQLLLLQQVRQSDNSLANARDFARRIIFENKMRQALPTWLTEIREQAYLEIKDI